jgi:glycosyltransferase involved in cell wall biosynthesis
MPVDDVRRQHGNDQPLDPRHPDARRLAARVGPRLPLASAIVCHSNYTQRLVTQSDRWRAVPSCVVPLPVQLGHQPAAITLKAELRRALGLDPDRPTVGLVAANIDSPYKGMPYAIDALQRLPDDAQVLLAGRNAHALVARLDRPAVALGYLRDDTELARCYAALDVLVFPSSAETFGLVAAEAMACGTPVVGFETSAVHELIGQDERGLTAPPFDADMLARQTQRLLRDDALARRLGQAGRDWIMRRHTREAYVQQTLACYQTAREHFAQR